MTETSSPLEGGLSPPECVNDPEEKEISDDDDDDRNHKHRRRETRSQSLEGEPLEQGGVHPYRKRNRPFQNGQNSDRNFSKFEKRRTIGPNFSQHSFGRGRGRDYQRDSRLSHQGPIPSGMFSGRGLSNVPNVPSAPWNNFGLIPPIPNGTIDGINPLGMPMLGSQLNPSLSMGIHRPRCRDFEEQGFCLRGDMCPMEHGVNRIVVEDVQSLSQFNLPVSLPNAHLMGTSTETGFVPPLSVPPNAVINSSGPHGLSSKSTVDDDSLIPDVPFSGADVYDPDQPLWNNNGHDTSTQLFGPEFGESETLMNAELSDRVAQSGRAGSVSQSTNPSVWGRINSSKSKSELKGKFQENRPKEIREISSGTQVADKQNNLSTFGPKTMGSSSKLLNDVGPTKKLGQKANRTLFVNCIPLKDNKRENLLSHFRKFGEVIDIYIPANSERAFVQFSKREEAEKALRAPDAVMGSRFIKLWWANRDNIPDEGMSGGNNVSVIAPKGKDSVQYVGSRAAPPNTPHSLVTAGNESKSAGGGGPKGPPLVQKKLESLEHLKEELRKKQEMLEQKRNEFRRQLDKLAKQGTGAKSEASDEQAMKKQKVEISTQTPKSVKSTDSVVSGSSVPVEKLVNQVSSVEAIPSPRSKTNSDPQSLKQVVHPVMPGVPSHVNRYKLDNRPTTFKICAPIPAGLSNVTALKDHFKIYGEVSNIDLEESNEEEDSSNPRDNPEAMKNYSARVSFTTRHAAEQAFSNGKSWQDHNLQFTWVTHIVPKNSRSSGESSSALKGVVNSEVQSEEKTSHNDPQDNIDQNSTKITHKPSDLPSIDGSRISGEDCLAVENQSHEKEENYIPLEIGDLGNLDEDQALEKTAVDVQTGGLETEANDTILKGEGEVA